MAEGRHRLRRGLTALTLLATGLSLLAAMAFFLLRREHPETAIFFGRVVWVGLIVGITGGALLTVAGALQALFTDDPEEEEEEAGAPEGRGSGGLGG